MLADFIRASVASAVLLAIAFIACFLPRHGFEEGIGWVQVLLPGFAIAAAVSDALYRLTPTGASLAFWAVLIFINFVLYGCICFLAIKAYRHVSKIVRRENGAAT